MYYYQREDNPYEEGVWVTGEIILEFNTDENSEPDEEHAITIKYTEYTDLNKDYLREDDIFADAFNEIYDMRIKDPNVFDPNSTYKFHFSEDFPILGYYYNEDIELDFDSWANRYFFKVEDVDYENKTITQKELTKVD